ncbi:MAG: TRAP transporter small permease subunit [Alphaproteobacteria bacterium]|nr:MAG: TRAP transporter small permease subunit [Alphaproteobacteria bacterium]
MTAGRPGTGEGRMDRLTRRLAVLGGVALLAYAAAVVVDALLRWLIGLSILGLADVGALMLPVILASFLPALMWRRGNIEVSLLGHVLGARRGAAADIFADGATFLFLLLLLGGYADYLSGLGGRHSVILEWPLWPATAVACGLLAVTAGVQLVALGARIRRYRRDGRG